MEATQVQQLKLNVTNINSFLKKSNKTYIGLKKQNSTLLSNQIQRRKQESKEKKIETRRTTGFGLGKVGDKIASTGGSIFDKILGFGSFILSGVLVNSLPKIIKTVKGVIDSIVEFVTPLQSAFSLITAYMGGDFDKSKYDADKKRVDDKLVELNKDGGLIDQIAEQTGILEPLIKALKPAIEQVRNVVSGKNKVLAVKDGKEGVKDLDTGEFTERQFTADERKKYAAAGGKGEGKTPDAGGKGARKTPDAGGKGAGKTPDAGGAPSSGAAAPSGPSGSSGKYGSLLDFIGSGEGGYNSMNQGTQGNSIVGSTNNASSKLGKNLTDMTIGEIMDRQAYLMDRSNPQISDYGIFAAGKYQIIPGTMPGAVAAAGLSRSDKFTPQNQDKLGMALIVNKRPYVGKYLRGEHNDVEGAMLELAREFASMPDPNTGRSLYGSGNKAFHSVDEVREALIKARNKPQPKITPKITPKTRDKNNQASVLNTTMGEEGTTTIMVLRQPVIVG